MRILKPEARLVRPAVFSLAARLVLPIRDSAVQAKGLSALVHGAASSLQAMAAMRSQTSHSLGEWQADDPITRHF